MYMSRPFQLATWNTMLLHVSKERLGSVHVDTSTFFTLLPIGLSSSLNILAVHVQSTCITNAQYILLIVWESYDCYFQVDLPHNDMRRQSRLGVCSKQLQTLCNACSYILVLFLLVLQSLTTLENITFIANTVLEVYLRHPLAKLLIIVCGHDL